MPKLRRQTEERSTLTELTYKDKLYSWCTNFSFTGTSKYYAKLFSENSKC